MKKLLFLLAVILTTLSISEVKAQYLPSATSIIVKKQGFTGRYVDVSLGLCDNRICSVVINKRLYTGSSESYSNNFISSGILPDIGIGNGIIDLSNLTQINVWVKCSHGYEIDLDGLNDFVGWRSRVYEVLHPNCYMTVERQISTDGTYSFIIRDDYIIFE